MTKHLLSNDVIEVEVAPVGYYQGPRYDWTGWVTQVTLKKGNHTFCTKENLQPSEGSGGIGICNEFGINQPIGYLDLPVGGQFPKLGTGLLTRLDDSEYDFRLPYPVRPFRVETEQGKNSIHYIVHPIPCRGYAAKLEKTISIHNHRLMIDYTLLNVGSETIETNEYTHNFFSINSTRLGPEYQITFPVPVVFDRKDALTDSLMFFDQHVTWRHTPTQPFYIVLNGIDQNDFSVSWEMRHRFFRVGLREISKFPVSAIKLWGTTHVVSPEVFIDIRLKPGEMKNWTRIYEFFQY